MYTDSLTMDAWHLVKMQRLLFNQGETGKIRLGYE